MGRDTIQLENAVSTISQKYLLEFTSEYRIPKSLHPELLGPEDPIVKFLEGKVSVYTKFFEFSNFRILISQFLFDILGHYHTTELIEEKESPATKHSRPQNRRPKNRQVKTETRPRAAHKVPLLTATANRVIDIEDMTGASGSLGTPSTVDKSPLDFSNEDPLLLITERTRMEEQVQDKLSFRKAVITEDPDSEKFASFTLMVGSPGSIYHPGWGVTNNCRLDTSAACQDMVDHIVPPGYFLKLCHLPNDEFLNQYNTTLAQQVGIGSQLRLRFEQEAKLLKKAVAQIARRDQRIQAKKKHIKNLEALLEAEADMKDTTEAKNVELVKELESFRELYPHMLTAIAGRRWVIRHSLRLAIMKCTEYIELRLVFVDVVSAGIAKGMSEGLKHRVEHGKAKVDLAAIEAYDPEADAKYVAALHALKDLKSLTEDYMLTKEITRVSGEVNNVVIAGAQFLDEMDSLGTRHVPAKMAEFFHEIQMKDCKIVDKLQILVREMELNACKKNYSLRSLMVSFRIEDVGEVAFVK
nr:hypothetical protein [Tanacetum cinerariifolium]